MKHIVFYSGGIGSWYTAKRVIEQKGKENVILLFTDTMIEDADLYRFMKDTEKDFGIEITRIADGRTPWEVFKDINFLGNSRVAQCSEFLKQKTAAKWIKENFKPDECVLYLGIDWTESHRQAAPIKNWSPYKVEFPMCEEPFVTKDEMLDALKERGIEIPLLYKLGFSHNNCGGMCVRGGQGHFAKLLETFPERFEFLENFEQEMRDQIGKDVSILSKPTIQKIWVDEWQGNLEELLEGKKPKEIEAIKKAAYQEDGIWKIDGHYVTKTVKAPFTLKEFRKKYEQNDDGEQVDMFDVGGCGCFVTNN